MPTALSSTPPLSIAVVGAGGIGSAFAFQLARAGHAVTVVARPGSPRLGQLSRDAGIVDTRGERAAVTVCDALDETAAYDLVLVTTLAHQVEPLLPALRRSRASAIQFMFNTFDPARLTAAVGAERCSLGMPFIMARLDGDGRLEATISPRRRTLHGDARWVRLFQEAGLPSAFEPDMALWLRCHVPLCIAMESISVAGQRRGAGASWREAQVVARATKAGFDVLNGLGLPLHPPSNAVISASPGWMLAAMLWSVSRVTSFRELLATGEAECRSLVAAMAAAALETTPPRPAAAAAIAAASPSERR